MSEPRELLKSLFGYIEEQLKEIDPRGYHLSKIDGFKLVPNEVSQLPRVDLDVKTEGDHVWMRVCRLESTQPPEVKGEVAQALIRKSSNPFGPRPEVDENGIRQALLDALPEDVTKDQRDEIEREIRSHADQSLAEHLVAWEIWAANEIPRRKTIELYSELFALSRKISSTESTKPIELVCGIGVSAWKLGAGEKIDFQYPLLTQSLEIVINPQSMDIEVRPRAVDTRVELDAFVATDVVGASEVERSAREHLEKTKEQPVTPFDSSSFMDVLKLIARNLDGKGKYVTLEESIKYPVSTDDLTITETWVLFTRPKSNNYLVDDLRKLRASLESGCDIPGGPLALVTPASDVPVSFEAVNFRGISSRGSESSTPEELYFPLPYNQEQVTIIQRLQRANGVTVQGPPGTGKTHTIANIICHYLASGKRVLVTSRGEQALKVLQAKVPEEIRPLTVSLLTSDRDGIRQFQGSIEAIQHQVSQLNPEQVGEDIRRLKQSIDRTHSELLRIDQRIDEIAEAQLSEIEVDGQPMRAQRMAELVVSGESKYGWFDDELSIDSQNAPPFGEGEMSTLRDARRALGDKIEYVGNSYPNWQQLPSVEEVVELHGVLSKIKEIDSELKSGQLLPLLANTSEVADKARVLISELDDLSKKLKPIEETENGWGLRLRNNIRSGENQSEVDALVAIFEEIDQIVEARADFLKKPVEIPEVAISSLKYREAVARGSQTGKAFGIFAIGAGDVKQLVTETKVSGLPVASADDWAHINKYLDLANRLVSFSARWNQFSDLLDLPKVENTLSKMREIEKISLNARECHGLCLENEARVLKLAEEVFAKPPVDQLLGSTSDIDSIRKQLQTHLLKSDLIKASAKISGVQERLVGCGGGVTQRLQTFVNESIGKSDLDSSQVAAIYSALIEELRQIASLSQKLSDVKDMSGQVEAAGAVKFAALIRKTPVADNGEDTIIKSDWKTAWTWARLKSHLNTIEARKELVEMSEKRSTLEVALSKMYKDVVAKEAWLSTKRNATPRVLQALAGYATAIRRIGQGTGPNAFRYRRDAQSAMLQAAGAVPCWIMSHTKISESMPPDIGAFDLVIVDEASQSDLWALPAIVRGKKILVVGDDKQVSPDGGFISSGKIQNLMTRFLSDQPYKEEMTPEKSLYDLASRVFAAQQVMLREHFRCVQPIISYSNRQFYSEAIQPLRIPKASERLDPPLIDVYVDGGYRDKQDKNILEAHAIAEEIANIVALPEYDGRSIGVVSLLGFDQAKLIDSLVRERCDAGELLRRDFECGDARTFQGSERDIIFLSMVVDGSSCKALSGNAFEQRFNVATSRARDRMYLFRSVKLSDLSEKDLRASLLNHFDKPIIVEEEDTTELLDLCESEFEREVYTLLVSKGYKVIPQVKSGAYRIDMVVEGLNDTRLAIELDGDEFHGPDRWQHDMARQRVLERAGWIFWRCFASTWSLRKEVVFDELIEKLVAMGIEPIGTLGSIPSIVEKRVWKAPEVELTLNNSESTD